MIGQENWDFIIAGGTVASVVFAIVSAQWRLSNWLSNQFTLVKDLVYSNIKEVTKKLEYHEQHDDVRFSQIDKALNEVRLNMAVHQAVNAVLDHNGYKEKRTVRRPAREETSSGIISN